MKLDLPYPHKALWPNGRAHWATKAREVKKHRQWAWAATKGQKLPVVGDGPVRIKITVHGKRTGPLPDRDGVIGANKAYQDGISSAIGIDDKHFAEPTVEFAETRTGRFVIEVGL